MPKRSKPVYPKYLVGYYRTQNDKNWLRYALGTFEDIDPEAVPELNHDIVFAIYTGSELDELFDSYEETLKKDPPPTAFQVLWVSARLSQRLFGPTD